MPGSHFHLLFLAHSLFYIFKIDSFIYIYLFFLLKLEFLQRFPLSPLTFKNTLKIKMLINNHFKLSGKHNRLTMCRLNVGPPYVTLAHHAHAQSVLFAGFMFHQLEVT